MLIYFPKKCLLCGKLFIPNSNKQKFCDRNHYMKFYRIRARGSHYPQYICSHCHRTLTLNFNPKINPTRWLQYKCPFCHEPIINAIKTELIKIGLYATQEDFEFI